MLLCLPEECRYVPLHQPFHIRGDYRISRRSRHQHRHAVDYGVFAFEPANPFSLVSNPAPALPNPCAVVTFTTSLYANVPDGDTVPLPVTSPTAGIAAKILSVLLPALVARRSSRSVWISVVSPVLIPPRTAIPEIFDPRSNPTRRVSSSASGPVITRLFAGPVAARAIVNVPPFSTEPFGSLTPAAVIRVCSSSIGNLCPVSFTSNHRFLGTSR